MSNFYKITPEIREFIINQKRANPVLSCRGMVALIDKSFSLKLSKSMINNIIKESKLNSPVGRRRIRPVLANIAARKEDALPSVNRFPGFIINGGCFLLKIADIQLSLSSNLARSLTVYFPRIPLLLLQKHLEFLIYEAFFEDKSGLGLVIGGSFSAEELSQTFQGLTRIPLQEINEILNKSGAIDYKINHINDLYEKILLRLNLYVQTNFFTSSSQLLDFSAMRARFYSLFAKLKRDKGVLEIHFFYRRGFPWGNDIIWRDDFLYAANKVNESRIFTPENEQIWINHSPQILDIENAYS